MGASIINEQHSELIGAIYEGPLEEQPWQSFLAQLRDAMGAVNATLVLRPPSAEGKGLLLADGGSLDTIATYSERLFVLDPFVDLPPGEAHCLLEYVDEQEYLNSDLYKLCMQPAGLYDCLGADLRGSGGLQARLRASRARGAQAFGDDDKALLLSIMPHLERAIRIHSRLNITESERALYAGAVQQLAVGTVILDDNSCVLDCNEVASRLLRTNDGLACVDQRLRVKNREQAQELKELIGAVLDNQQEAKSSLVKAMRVSRPSGLSDLGLVIRAVPVSEWSEGQSAPAVAIFISDPEQSSEAPTDAIASLFGLTPSEAALAMHLAKGLTLDEAAEQMEVSRNTARAHLRAIFSKTGVSRQTMLVRLVLKSVATLA